MAQEIQNVALDAALNYIKTNANVLHICSQAPTTYAQVATYSLASKSGLTISSPTSVTNGRKVTVSATTGGTVATAGTSNCVVLVSGTELLAVKALSGTSVQALVAGNPFTTDAFDITVTSGS